ncbi:MAG: hypothetical protein JO038_08550 [Alphaproteobacteria bacterium]|nr:hypothetical protein [Alphaproteobacteria bacterium]
MHGRIRHRTAVALAGILAILWQAVLFGWHSHPLGFVLDRAPTLAAAGPSGADPGSGSAEDSCEICLALHHHGAAPVEFFAPALPQPSACCRVLAESVPPGLPPFHSFQSRAPPRA